jgi:hypothetical protein
MAVFKIYLQFQKQRKVGLVVDDSHGVLGQQLKCEKGSVRWSVVMLQQAVFFLSPKFGAESSHIFTQPQ